MKSSLLTWATARYLTAATLVFVLLVGVGREVSHGQSKLIFILLLVVAFVALAVLQRGAAIGILVLAGMDGVPFFETQNPVATHFTVQDVAIFALIGCAFAWRFVSRRPHYVTSTVKLVRALGGALLVWWIVTMIRTTAPAFAAAQFGSDFFFFAALLIFLPGIRLTPRELRALLVVLGVGVCVFAVGQILTVEGLATPSGLIHFAGATTTNGLRRVYAPMIDLVSAGLAVSIAALVLGRGTRNHRVAIPITILLGASLVLQLTRARWLALLASIVLVSLWFAMQGERRIASRLRRSLGGFLAVVITALCVALLVAPGANVGGAVVQRSVSIFTDIGSSNKTTSTVAVRTQVAGEMLTLLGGQWPLGLGFVPPSAHYFAPLPHGSLRDVDVGVLNPVMTMGAIGTVLIYLPLIVVLIACMRAARTTRPGRRPWLNYGGQMWIVGTIASSLTLVTLFSKSGLVLSGVIVALLCQPEVIGIITTTRASVLNGSARRRIRTHRRFDGQRVPS